MAEGQTSVITKARRIKFAKVTSGAIKEYAPITQIAFGDGGVTELGEPIMPVETQTELKNEFCRYDVGEISYPIETTARYSVTIPKQEQAGHRFNEMALVDSDGTLCAIKTMYTKQKDADVAFTFEFDDEF